MRCKKLSFVLVLLFAQLKTRAIFVLNYCIFRDCVHMFSAQLVIGHQITKQDIKDICMWRVYIIESKQNNKILCDDATYIPLIIKKNTLLRDLFLPVTSLV